VTITEYDESRSVRTVDIWLMSDYVAMPVDAMPPGRGRVMGKHIPRLVPAKLSRNIYQAKELYYKVLEQYPDLRGKVKLVVGVPDMILAPDFVCSEGNAYIRDGAIYVELIDREIQVGPTGGPVVHWSGQ
jgi:hypothetical protein